MDGFVFRPATLTEWKEISELESTSYPPDEAATEEKIRYRIEQAQDFFYVLRNAENELVGFVNGTCVRESVIHHDSMSHHAAGGRTLVIHSVVTAPAFRRQRFGAPMVTRYVQLMQEKRLVDRILLLSKAPLLHFYMQSGFKVNCLSSVEHGQDKWFEMGIDLRAHFGEEQLQVDAFTTGTAFSGNPAAVVFHHHDDNWMQNVAMENNLAETAFLERMDGEQQYKLRWFTPNVEVELCGHATLAAAHALYETGRVEPCASIAFHTVHRGVLTAAGQEDGSISLSFPVTAAEPIALSNEELDFLTSALRIDRSDVLFTGQSPFDLMAEITVSAFERTTVVDHSKLALLGGRGVIITCAGGAAEGPSSGCHFRSRCFFPICGINEDPVTGSAHCALAPYWAAKLPAVDCLLAFQASGRGGLLKLRLLDSGNRVELTGTCTTTMKTVILA